VLNTARTRKIARISFLVIGLVVLILGGGTWYLFDQIDEKKADLAELILDHPGTMAVAAYTIDAEGEFVNDGNSIFYNADEQLVMASTMKIVVLAAYADAVVSGGLDPNESIQVADLERYYLPFTDGGAHATGLNSIGVDTDEDGFARDRSAAIILDDIARIMMHYSGNAETDYLIARLGMDRIAAVMQEAGLESHTPIRLTLGPALVIFNHETLSPSMDQLQQLVVDVSMGDTSYPDRLTELYLNDLAWREAQLEYMRSLDENTFSGLDAWAYQTEASLLLPQGTAREYARMMARIASGQFISSDVSGIMQQMLESVPSDWPLRVLYFDRFGAKDGVTAGVLTLAAYAVPKRGSLGEQWRVVVIILNSIPPDAWVEQLQLEGHYLLAIDLVRGMGVFSELAGIGDE
jgi:D-alanyl-D-alanine carboxypeptidase